MVVIVPAFAKREQCNDEIIPTPIRGGETTGANEMSEGIYTVSRVVESDC